MSQLWTPDSSYPAVSRFDEIQFTRLSQKNSFRIQWEEYGHFLNWSSDRQFFLNTVMVMLKFLADFEGVNIFTHSYLKVASSRSSWLVTHLAILECLLSGNLMLMYCDVWPKFAKLNSRPVFCWQLYGKSKVNLHANMYMYS